METDVNRGKLIIFSAPSGAGKTTIVRSLLHDFPNLRFSVSATTRKPRGTEKHGREYYFLSMEDFLQQVNIGGFIEHEEVYDGILYGTLKSEVEKLLASGADVVFDIDVMGGINIKKIYGDEALSLFIMPPDIETLQERLVRRGSETEESLRKRVEKARWELTFAREFDVVVINDDLPRAIKEISVIVKNFTGHDCKE